MVVTRGRGHHREPPQQALEADDPGGDAGWEEEELNVGPLSVLTKLVKNSTQGLINRQNKRTLLGWVRAFNTCGRI